MKNPALKLFIRKFFNCLVPVLILGSAMVRTQAAPKYWDTTAGAGNGVGGSGTWAAQSTAFFSTASTGDATLTSAATTDDDIFQGTAGTITFSFSAPTANSFTFNTTGYAITTSSGTTRTMTGAITLGNSVTLTLATFGGSGQLNVDSVSGGTSSALTVGGACSLSTDAIQIGLNSGATVASSAPITISTAGSTGVSGFKPASGTATINATIVNNSGVTTMLGAASGNTLNVAGGVSGSAGVQFSAGSSGGAGTVNLNAANTYTGPTIFNGTASGTVKLGVDNALPTSTAVTMGASSGNGQKLDLNGHNQTIGSLTSVSGGTGSITDNSSGAGPSTLTISGSTSPAAFGLVISNGATHAISLVRAGTGTTTLSAANTYSGNTTITNTATLALAAGGSIAKTPQISIAAGAIFDVSAAGFTFTGSSPVQTLAGSSTNGIATINAPSQTVTLNSGALLAFQALGGSGSSVGKISVTGTSANLTLNGNAVTVNVTGAALAAGTYRLLDCLGTLTGTANTTATITGTALTTGYTATISTTTGAAGHVDLVVTAPLIPSFSSLSTSQSINYGTASITLSGKLSATGPVYPANGETVSITINGSVQTTTINDATGDFSKTFVTATNPYSASAYTITYAYAGNGSTLGAAVNDTSTTLTVNKANLTVTAKNVTKTQGTTLSSPVTGSTDFTSSGLANSETIGSVTITYGSGAAAGDAAGVYIGSVVPSAATGGTFNAANYNAIGYVAGNLTNTASPSISTSGTLAAVNTTYGTASASPTSFTVSGGNLTGNLTATPPSGFEISLSSGSSYTTSLPITASGTLAPTTVYVRLAATTTAGTYSGNVSISGGGATTATIATAASTVSPAPLTITGITATNKVYDQTTTAGFTGTPAYSGLVNSESFSVSGTPSASFAFATVSNGIPVTVSGFTAPSANYSLTQPILSANITPLALTVSGATVATKFFDGKTNATITGATLVGVISPDVVTVSGGGFFTDTNANTGIPVTATLTLGGVDSTNYSLTQPTGLTGTILQTNQTVTFSALPGKTNGAAPFTLSATANSGLSFTYLSSNPSVATISGNTVTIVGTGNTIITATNSGNGNYSPVSATQTLSVGQPLVAGDLAIIAFGPSGTDKFAVVLLRPIVAGTTIVFTDNGFSSATTGRTGEGFLTYAAQTDLPAGTVLTWLNGQSITGTGWSSAAPTSFSLNATGEQLFAFQGDPANWASQSGITLLYGVETKNTWLTTGTADTTSSYAPDSSLLPSAYLFQVSTKSDIYLTATTISDTVANIITAVTTPLNYSANNAAQTLPSYTQFIVNPTATVVTSDANPALPGATVNLTATVTWGGAGSPTGNVTFKDNGTAIGSGTLNGSGQAVLSTSMLSHGSHPITAEYAPTGNFFGSTNSPALSQIINTPPVATGTNYYRSTSVTTVTIPISSLLAKVTDADSDSVMLSATSTSTNGVTLANDSVNLTYVNSSPVNDQFTNTFVDAYGATATAVVTITVSTNAIGGQVQTLNLSGGGSTAALNFVGVPSYSYTVQSSTNLLNWSDVLTTNAPTSGSFLVNDILGSTPPANKFYRLRYNP